MLCACHKSNSTMAVIQDVKKVYSADFHTHFFPHEITQITLFGTTLHGNTAFTLSEREHFGDIYSRPKEHKKPE